MTVRDGSCLVLFLGNRMRFARSRVAIRRQVKWGSELPEASRFLVPALSLPNSAAY